MISKVNQSGQTQHLKIIEKQIITVTFVFHLLQNLLVILVVLAFISQTTTTKKSSLNLVKKMYF